MLVLRLTLVPLLIAGVTMAGRRWGAGVEGLLGGLPVVAGPIVLIIALEQGAEFGALTATAAISAIVGLLVFGVVYCWASIRWSWPMALICSLTAWLIAAAGLARLPAVPEVTLPVAVLALLVTPWALPRIGPPAAARAVNDLPFRMITGGLLTLFVTGASASLGVVWSGILAAFPIIGVVLAVFTHRADGARQVAQVYRGMVKGLVSFAAFFLILALLWPRGAFWSACALATGAGVVTQALVYGFASQRKALQARQFGGPTSDWS